jgi:hypothetical protein
MATRAGYASCPLGQRERRNQRSVCNVLVLIGSYLLLVFVLPVALSVLVSYRALPHGRECPQCRGDTIRLQAPHLRLVAALNPFSALHRRWCLCCGWEGTARLPRERPGTPRTPRTPTGPVPARSGTADATRPAATQTLDVRSLEVDGTPWRVMLQCWGGTGEYYGRFVFVGPTGRLWLDVVESFSGRTEHDVLGQALSLPPGLLEHRLRRLVADC